MSSDNLISPSTYETFGDTALSPLEFYVIVLTVILFHFENDLCRSRNF